jgi:hypothetical protein
MASSLFVSTVPPQRLRIHTGRLHTDRQPCTYSHSSELHTSLLPPRSTGERPSCSSSAGSWLTLGKWTCVPSGPRAYPLAHADLFSVSPSVCAIIVCGQWTAMLTRSVGYHRLWSHRAFTAAPSLRVVLAAMGSTGFQGSIKWWVLRHRLHHR